MSKKMIPCKTCGEIIAKSAASCPHCGAKNKKKHTALGIILLFLGITMVFAAIGSSGEDSTAAGDVNNQQVSQPSSSQIEEKTEFGVGEKLESNGVSVTLLDVSENTGSSIFTPTDGNVFVVCEFEIENNTNHDIAVSSMMSFEAYFDDYAANLDLTAMAMSDKTQLDGTVAGGKKMKGIVGYQAPTDWSTVELHFTPDFWSFKDIVFIHSK